MNLWDYPISDETRGKILSLQMRVSEESKLTVSTEQVEDRFSVSISFNIPLHEPAKQ